MNITFTHEQKEFASAMRRLFAHECPSRLVRQPASPDRADDLAHLWESLRDAGVFGLALPIDCGGQGASLVDLGPIYEEGGRALCPMVVYSTIEFGLALLRVGGSSAASPWLAKVAAGEIVGTLALADPGNSSAIAPLLRAERHKSGWVISGSLDLVPNADVADVLLTTARTSDGGGTDIAFVVPRESYSVEQRRTIARDSQCRVVLDRVRVDDLNVLTENLKLDDVRWAANALTALHCVDMVGGAQAVIDQTVQYIKDRHQFGRPIASFQAAQHHVANMHIAVEGAWLAAFQALALASRGHVAERESAIAKLKANEAYKLATLTAHQLQGGMGYVIDTDLHLWSERAKAMELRDGAWDTQIDRIVSALGFGTSASA